MSEEPEHSIFGLVMEQVGRIFGPVLEAARVQKELGVCCWNETCSAVEQAGFQIVRADLPPAVGGFAMVVDGQRYIVTNRCDSLEEQRYTISHELGHHVLGHLNPSSSIPRIGLGSNESQEFQADQFAAAWLMQSAKTEPQKEFWRRNSRAKTVLGKSAIMVGLIVVPALLLYFLVSLFAKSSVA